jgi:putative two-component system response regulator
MQCKGRTCNPEARIVPHILSMAEMAQGSRTGAPPRKAQTILVVDDKLDTLLLVRELLTSRGYNVLTASDADEAVQTIRNERPDLILLDVIMPGRSGYDLCRELKDDPATRLIPIVMITGLSDRSDRIRGIEAGADDFLSKPLYPEELYARVKSLLKLKHFTDELENAEAVLFSLALGVEARDPFTGDHCSRLAHYAAMLGRHLHFDHESVVALERGGYLHDLGKIKVPDEILKKGCELTAQEWEVMKQHPVWGEAICAPLKSFKKVLPIIRHHHEHWNGSGYPDQLSGHNIPVLARVLQVVDVYDALATARSYKPALPAAQVRETMIREARRGLWDYELVREFFSMLEQQRQAA